MIDRLVTQIKKKKAPIVVGLDPQLRFIPEKIRKKAYGEFGETLEGAAEAVWVFNRMLTDAVCDLVPAVKPQIAMYEQFGIAGVAAFKKTVDYCHEKGLIVIGDIKRGDIGSTSECYAAGHLGSIEIEGKKYIPFNEDFATVNPYLGSDGVKPFIGICEKEDKGIFVLVKTSNKSSGEFQDKRLSDEDGRRLYELVAEKVKEWGNDLIGQCGYSEIGAVVGATYPEEGKLLRSLMPSSYILVPGYGAQGGKGSDLACFFNKDGLGAIVNSSRGIIAAYQNEKYAGYGEDGFADAARKAVIDMREDINGSI